ncbi:MAG: hypothetical protein PHV55_09755, partial [Candidatus Omnitrophica bacterium]|nr:hypothetical protein [Candidatus Omnitrophota bacterium]
MAIRQRLQNIGTELIKALRSRLGVPSLELAIVVETGSVLKGYAHENSDIDYAYVIIFRRDSKLLLNVREKTDSKEEITKSGLDATLIVADELTTAGMYTLFFYPMMFCTFAQLIECWRAEFVSRLEASDQQASGGWDEVVKYSNRYIDFDFSGIIDYEISVVRERKTLLDALRSCGIDASSNSALIRFIEERRALTRLPSFSEMTVIYKTIPFSVRQEEYAAGLWNWAALPRQEQLNSPYRPVWGEDSLLGHTSVSYSPGVYACMFDQINRAFPPAKTTEESRKRQTAWEALQIKWNLISVEAAMTLAGIARRDLPETLYVDAYIRQESLPGVPAGLQKYLFVLDGAFRGMREALDNFNRKNRPYDPVHPNFLHPAWLRGLIDDKSVDNGGSEHFKLPESYDDFTKLIVHVKEFSPDQVIAFLNAITQLLINGKVPRNRVKHVFYTIERVFRIAGDEPLEDSLDEALERLLDAIKDLLLSRTEVAELSLLQGKWIYFLSMLFAGIDTQDTLSRMENSLADLGDSDTLAERLVRFQEIVWQCESELLDIVEYCTNAVESGFDEKNSETIVQMLVQINNEHSGIAIDSDDASLILTRFISMLARRDEDSDSLDNGGVSKNVLPFQRIDYEHDIFAGKKIVVGVVIDNIKHPGQKIHLQRIPSNENKHMYIVMNPVSSSEESGLHFEILKDKVRLVNISIAQDVRKQGVASSIAVWVAREARRLLPESKFPLELHLVNNPQIFRIAETLFAPGTIECYYVWDDFWYSLNDSSFDLYRTFGPLKIFDEKSTAQGSSITIVRKNSGYKAISCPRTIDVALDGYKASFRD